jgi:hypothetical protein
MNKKLFFAGFALLAAVSFTSCNSDNPIDITNPNGGAAFTPTVTSSDDYDLVFNIKETDDVKKLWDNSVPATVKAVLAKKDSIRVAYNVNNYSLDGKAIEVPNFFQGATDKKVLDIAFIGTFASQALPAPAVGNHFFSVDFDTNLPGAEVNLDLITDVEQMLLQAQNERVTLGGNAIIGTFFVRANTTAQEALKIVDGVYVDAINVFNGAISVDSKKQIGAKIISNDENLNDKGAKVGDLDLFLDRIYVVNDVTVGNIDKATMKEVKVAENTTLTLGSKKAKVEAFVGEGTAKKPSIVVLKGDKDDLTNLKSAVNVTLQSNTATNVKDFSIFSDVTFDAPINMLADSIYNATFKKAINITATDDTDDFTFANVNFGPNVTFNVKNGIEYDKTVKSDIVAIFDKSPNTKTYTQVASEDQVSIANAKRQPAVYYQKLYNKAQFKNLMTNDSIAFDGKKFIVNSKAEKLADGTASGYTTPYSTLEANLTAAAKAYNTLYANEGGKSANASTQYTDYKKAFADLYGNAVDKANPDVSGGVPCKITSGVAKYNAASFSTIAGTTATAAEKAAIEASPYALTANLRAFVDGANAKIKDSYWFEIRYITQDGKYSIDPDPFLINFNDCKVGDNAVEVKNLREMFGEQTGFASAAEAWFYVVLNGEGLGWKHVSGTTGANSKYILWE